MYSMQEIRAFESAAVFRFYVGVVSTTDNVLRKHVNSSHLSPVADFLSRVFCQPNAQRSVHLADHCQLPDSSNFDQLFVVI